MPRLRGTVSGCLSHTRVFHGGHEHATLLTIANARRRSKAVTELIAISETTVGGRLGSVTSDNWVKLLPVPSTGDPGRPLSPLVGFVCRIFDPVSIRLRRRLEDGPAGCTIVGFDRGSRRHEQLGYRLATCQLPGELFSGLVHRQRERTLCRPDGTHFGSRSGCRPLCGNTASPDKASKAGQYRTLRSAVCDALSRQMQRCIEKATSLLTAEEERQLKLEVGADWPPRTKPQEGEGYNLHLLPGPDAQDGHAARPGQLLRRREDGTGPLRDQHGAEGRVRNRRRAELGALSPPPHSDRPHTDLC